MYSSELKREKERRKVDWTNASAFSSTAKVPGDDAPVPKEFVEFAWNLSESRHRSTC